MSVAPSSQWPVSPRKQQTENLNPTNAARLLKRLAESHKAGNPIPTEIEEATDKWVWLKLQNAQPGMATPIRTGGRVSKYFVILPYK